MSVRLKGGIVWKVSNMEAIPRCKKWEDKEYFVCNLMANQGSQP